MQNRLSLLNGGPGHDPSACPDCPDGCLDAYHVETSHENSARTAWQEAVDLAFGEPALAVVLGACLGSLLVEPLSAAPVLVHLSGGTESVRSQALRSAMSVVGQPDALVCNWFDPPRSILNRVDVVAPLPIALQALDRSPRSTRLIGPNGQPPGTVIVSAGQHPLPADAKGPSRLEVTAPASPGAAAGLLHAITTTHYGWPRIWLHESGVVDQVHDWYQLSRDVISGKYPSAGGIADTLALCAVGFGALGHVVGRGFAFYGGMGAALRAWDGTSAPALHLISST